MFQRPAEKKDFATSYNATGTQGRAQARQKDNLGRGLVVKPAKCLNFNFAVAKSKRKKEYRKGQICLQIVHILQQI